MVTFILFKCHRTIDNSIDFLSFYLVIRRLMITQNLVVKIQSLVGNQELEPCDLTQMVNFPTQISDSDSHIPALLVLFFSADVSICSMMVKSDHIIVSVSIDFPSTQNFCADWDCLHHHLGDVPLEDICKLRASAVASKFCEWVRVGMDV